MPEDPKLLMAQTLASVTVVVRDYDEAIAFFTRVLDYRDMKARGVRFSEEADADAL